MGPLRGAKRDAWEGGHRVPFLARWPGHIPSQRVSDEIICLVDLMATSAALVGAKLPDSAGEDSYNILPALLGERTGRPLREATILHSGSGEFALRQDDWVFIDAPASAATKEPEWLIKERGYQPDNFPGQLYDLRDDLVQRSNRYAEEPEVVTRLKALLEKYKADGRSTPGVRHPTSKIAPGQAPGIPDEK